MAERDDNPQKPDLVEEADLESFPASDPPSWTLGVLGAKALGDPDAQTRAERDSMGEVRVPKDALYGAQTQRAIDNFPAAAYRLQPAFFRAMGLIKACAAAANLELGGLSKTKAEAIGRAADEIGRGGHNEQFAISVYQTGSATSTNMNVNEVIARLSGAHPNDDVNRSQSSNDVIPSAIHIAAARLIAEGLFPAMDSLRVSLETKAREFWDVIKIGRTHLQDATPIRLGQEFSGYAHQLTVSIERIKAAQTGLLQLPLGGTAVGTGINAPPRFAARAIELIAKRTGLPFIEARNHFEAQAAKDAVLFVSGALKTYAVALTKIANDIRWLGSGPRAGLGELILPELQPGSSIMPGKVNPVIPESVLMICAQVVGHDAAITWGCASGYFELNTMMPLLAFNLIDSIELLTSGSRAMAERCVDGLKADTSKTADLVERSLGMATALVPDIGYDKAAAIAKEAHKTGESVRAVALRTSGLSETRIAELLAAAITL